MLEYWTAYYAAQAARGEAVSFEGEDDDYHLEAILARLEQDAENAENAENPENPDNWETVIDERAPGSV